uniref:Uncharacterized protein n=1 Tax=Anguilla anguilla TaxID=7936 RepID=A0A0E9T0Y3_ANGAN
MLVKIQFQLRQRIVYSVRFSAHMKTSF